MMGNNSTQRGPSDLAGRDLCHLIPPGVNVAGREIPFMMGKITQQICHLYLLIKWSNPDSIYNDIYIYTYKYIYSIIYINNYQHHPQTYAWSKTTDFAVISPLVLGRTSLQKIICKCWSKNGRNRKNLEKTPEKWQPLGLLIGYRYSQLPAVTFPRPFGTAAKARKDRGLRAGMFFVSRRCALSNAVTRGWER